MAVSSDRARAPRWSRCMAHLKQATLAWACVAPLAACGCDDGLDNDNDGLLDFVAPGCGTVTGDPGCSSPFDLTELGVGPP
jgi:hypothetical protein